MRNKLLKSLENFGKRVVRGYVPFLWNSVFNPGSEYLKYYRYICRHGYARHLYDFAHEYNVNSERFRPALDTANGLYYVIMDGKRLYFKRDMKPQKIRKLYFSLILEQDTRSAHCYMNSSQEVNGYTFIDVGSAEGLTSLSVIDNVRHIYLFEADEGWIEALEATFSPWKDKVTIIRKYVGDTDDDRQITLDKFFNDKEVSRIFLKMDIEGAERQALAGAGELLDRCTDLKFAICTYHLDDDEEVIGGFLRRHGCSFTNRTGYFRHRLRSVVLRGQK